MKRHSLDHFVYDLFEKNIDSIEYEDFIAYYYIKKNDVSVKIYKNNLFDILISVYFCDSIYYKEYSLSEQVSSKIRRLIIDYEDRNDPKLENDLTTVKNLIDIFNEDTELQESKDQPQ